MRKMNMKDGEFLSFLKANGVQVLQTASSKDLMYVLKRLKQTDGTLKKNHENALLRLRSKKRSKSDTYLNARVLFNSPALNRAASLILEPKIPYESEFIRALAQRSLKEPEVLLAFLNTGIVSLDNDAFFYQLTAYGKFGSELKKVMANYISSYAMQLMLSGRLLEANKMLTDALDRNHPIGAFFATHRAWTSGNQDTSSVKFLRETQLILRETNAFLSLEEVKSKELKDLLRSDRNLLVNIRRDLEHGRMDRMAGFLNIVKNDVNPKRANSVIKFCLKNNLAELIGNHGDEKVLFAYFELIEKLKKELGNDAEKIAPLLGVEGTKAARFNWRTGIFHSEYVVSENLLLDRLVSNHTALLKFLNMDVSKDNPLLLQQIYLRLDNEKQLKPFIKSLFYKRQYDISDQMRDLLLHDHDSKTTFLMVFREILKTVETNKKADKEEGIRILRKLLDSATDPNKNLGKLFHHQRGITKPSSTKGTLGELQKFKLAFEEKYPNILESPASSEKKTSPLVPKRFT